MKLRQKSLLTEQGRWAKGGKKREATASKEPSRKLKTIPESPRMEFREVAKNKKKRKHRGEC